MCTRSATTASSTGRTSRARVRLCKRTFTAIHCRSKHISLTVTPRKQRADVDDSIFTPQSDETDPAVREATCAVCRNDDDEHLLLLCDGCDSACHTYCLYPPLEEPPEDSWYCTICTEQQRQAYSYIERQNERGDEIHLTQWHASAPTISTSTTSGFVFRNNNGRTHYRTSSQQLVQKTSAAVIDDDDDGECELDDVRIIGHSNVQSPKRKSNLVRQRTPLNDRRANSNTNTSASQIKQTSTERAPKRSRIRRVADVPSFTLRLTTSTINDSSFLQQLMAPKNVNTQSPVHQHARTAIDLVTTPDAKTERNQTSKGRGPSFEDIFF